MDNLLMYHNPPPPSHDYLPPPNQNPVQDNFYSPPSPNFPPPPSPDYPSPPSSGYGRPSSEYGSPSSEYGSPSGVSPSSNLLPPILSTRESDLLPPILSSKPFPRDSLPPAPPSSSYLPPSSGAQQDPTHTQCCSHLLITTRGRAFETQSSKTGDSFARISTSSLLFYTGQYKLVANSSPPVYRQSFGSNYLFAWRDGWQGWLDTLYL